MKSIARRLADIPQPTQAEPCFRTIGDAAQELGLKPPVLRYWESRFEQLRPMKRPDGRRYYRPEDMEMLRRLQDLLHVQGLTLRGAARILSGTDESRTVQDAAPTTSAPGIAEDIAASASPFGRADESGLASAARLGRSVGELQAMVRDAVARGEFGEAVLAENESARHRLEALLERLTQVKTRMDVVRTSDGT